MPDTNLSGKQRGLFSFLVPHAQTTEHDSLSNNDAYYLVDQYVERFLIAIGV
jgi:hypothetical protein